MRSRKLPASQLVTPLFFIHALNFIQRHIYVCHIHIYTHTLFGEHIDIDITFRIVGPRLGPTILKVISISIYSQKSKGKKLQNELWARPVPSKLSERRPLTFFNRRENGQKLFFPSHFSQLLQYKNFQEVSRDVIWKLTSGRFWKCGGFCCYNFLTQSYGLSMSTESEILSLSSKLCVVKKIITATIFRFRFSHFLSIFYYDGLWHFQFAEHWALKNTTKMITKKKHVTWASLLLRNDKLHNHSHMPLDPLDHGSRSHSQSVQGTVQSIFYNRRRVLLESDSGRSTWVAGVVVEQE